MSDENKIESKKIWIDSPKYWLIYIIPNFFLWYWFIGVFLKGLLNLILPFKSILLIFPCIIIWFIFFIYKKWLKGFLYFVHLLFFPFIFILIVFDVIITILSKVINAIKIFWISIITLLSSWILLLIVQNAFYKGIFSILILISTFIFLLQLFKWAADPFSPVFSIYQLIWKWIENLINKHYLKDIKEGEKSEKIKTIEEFPKWFTNINNKLFEKYFSSSALLPFFVSGVISLFLIISLTFGITLYFIDRGFGFNFKGLNNNSSIFDYIYFSISTIVTNVPNEISPNTWLGKFFILLIMFTGILILSLFAMILFYSLTSKENPSLNKIKTYQSEIEKIIMEWKTKLEEPKNEKEMEKRLGSGTDILKD